MNQIVLTFIVLVIVVFGVSILNLLSPLLAMAAFLTFCLYMNQVIDIVGRRVLQVRAFVLNYFS